MHGLWPQIADRPYERNAFQPASALQRGASRAMETSDGGEQALCRGGGRPKPSHPPTAHVAPTRFRAAINQTLSITGLAASAQQQSLLCQKRPVRLRSHRFQDCGRSLLPPKGHVQLLLFTPRHCPSAASTLPRVPEAPLR